MKIYTRTINNIKVTAYNDSNVDWVVKAGDMSTQRFPKNKFTMKEAMKFMADIATK